MILHLDMQRQSHIDRQPERNESTWQAVEKLFRRHATPARMKDAGT
jgi:hypothetical protein